MLKPFLVLAFAFHSFNVNAQTPVAKHDALHVDGVQLTDVHNNPVVLRGMSYGWHNFWPRFYNAGAVDWLAKDWNCNVVRAAMGVEPQGGYLSGPDDSKAKIKAVVNGAIKSGIYVIIDFHSHHIRLKEAKEFFTEMATTYGKQPNIIYEIFNEPVYDSWSDIKAYSTEVIKAIRDIDPDNIILVGSPHWDQDIHLVADAPLKGFSNIMYTMHYYAGTHKQFLRDRCDYALNKGIPIFISESAGMEASGDRKIDNTEWQRWIDWSEKNKISWITWSVSDKNESCSVLLPTAGSEGSWKPEDLKESGVMSREFLRKYNGRISK